ncbi:unnamed protein product [Mytilus coruscus]|uniref:Uncharacterized protein n=1 Tax=Mytilus coruscus TaxID=42192 RepID=A0A6J8BEE8_MYTCO|nr:unnamed protein product [Mytilus coruscus]
MRRIRVSCDPKRWRHGSTENPADIATRGINPAELSNSIWMKGPAFLYNVSFGNLDNGPHQLVDADSDKEIRPDVQVAKHKLYLAAQQTESKVLKVNIGWLVHDGHRYIQIRAVNERGTKVASPAGFLQITSDIQPALSDKIHTENSIVCLMTKLYSDSDNNMLKRQLLSLISSPAMQSKSELMETIPDLTE